jgi:hypothetical protein
MSHEPAECPHQWSPWGPDDDGVWRRRCFLCQLVQDSSRNPAAIQLDLFERESGSG